MNKIYNSINLISGFEHFDKLNSQEINIHLLDYFIIKANSLLLYSNLRLMKIYTRYINNIELEDHIATMLDSYKFIKEMKYYDLKEITSEEFEKNCKDSLE